MLVDKAGDTLRSKLDVWYMLDQIAGLSTLRLFAQNAMGNDAEANLSMSQGRPFKAQSQQLQPGFMSSQMTNVDFGSICNLVSAWSQPSRKHAWLINQ